VSEPENGNERSEPSKAFTYSTISVVVEAEERRAKAVNQRVLKIDAVGDWLPERNANT
jgi:hypothetical protein